MDFIYDLETYPNIFTMAIGDTEGLNIGVLECSSRKNELADIVKVLANLKQHDHRMVGFNNTGFDWPILHSLLNNITQEDVTGPGEKIAEFCWAVCQDIIVNRKNMMVWNPSIKQLDLQKINHFDNKARRTSLKQLEFAMRMTKLADLPYKPGTYLDSAQMDELVHYNKHDIVATTDFYHQCTDKIAFRDNLTAKHGFDFTNFNDTKIGKQLFIHELESKLGHDICFTKQGWKKIPNQTMYQELPLCNVIEPMVKFDDPAFQAVHRWMMSQTLHSAFDKDTKVERLVTKDVFTKVNLMEDETGIEDFVKVNTRTELRNMRTQEAVYTYRNAGSAKRITDETNKLVEAGEEAQHVMVSMIAPNITATVNGFEFVYGLGGIHGSVSNRMVTSDREYVIMDIDVVSYYPSEAIEMGLFPAHLGLEFTEIYKALRTERLTHDKGTVENAALKLALNGVYGDSNNKYSPFYDPAFTMGITLNGQMHLTMLAEELGRIPGLQMVQINTDGMTVKVKRSDASLMIAICKTWEGKTSLELEYQPYTRMWVKDVNNYIAEKPDGSLKLKGCYEWDREWHQNRSHLCVAKAAVEYLVNGTPAEDTIENNDDIFDFMLFIKTAGRQRLELWDEDIHTEVQGRSRYYVSMMGNDLKRIDPPLPKTPEKERPVAIHSGFKVNLCNDVTPEMHEALINDIDMDFYVGEVEKITAFAEL